MYWSRPLHNFATFTVVHPYHGTPPRGRGAHTTAMLVPINFWILVAGGSAAAPPHVDVELCERVLSAHRLGDAALAVGELCNSRRPIAVELDAPRDARAFRLPSDAGSVADDEAPRELALREISFGEGGLGGKIWEAGIAMAIWVSLHEERLRGRRVLELGSGVGMAGLAASQVSSSDTHVTLSDRDSAQAAELLRMLRRNAADNRLEATTRALDWQRCLDASFEPLGTFDVVLAADCIYYESDAAALASAVMRHTAPSGTALLMNRVGREGKAVEALLRCLREAEGELVTEEITIVNNFSSESLSLVQWTAPART